MTLVDRGRSPAILVSFVVGLVGLVRSTPSAHAQSAEAEVLFREGRGLIKQGRLEAGCDKIAASERIEPSVGTLLNLGDCREKLGRIATAWAAFRKAEALARRTPGEDKRRAEAARRASVLEPKLTHLVLEVKQPTPGLVVKRDDEIVDPAAWNTAVPVDPDTYTIVAEAPGYQPWRSEVSISPRSRRRVVQVPPLAKAPEPPPVVTRVEPVEPAPAPVIRVEPAPQRVVAPPVPSRWTTTRKVSIAFGVAGLGALGAGAYFGLRAYDLRDRADERCPMTACADPIALRDNADAKDAARTANILYVAGGASIAAATVLWLVGKPEEQTFVSPTITDRQVGVSLAGRF